MALTQLDLNKKAPPTEKTDFRDKNAVERLLATKKFRSSCDNLKCEQVNLPLMTLYMPVCWESRFDREGIAKDLPMPDHSRRSLSPLTYNTIAFWAPSISCPRPCNGYRNRTFAKLQRGVKQSALWLSTHLFKPAEVFWAAVWARVMK
jgi:hypothetical protein